MSFIKHLLSRFANKKMLKYTKGRSRRSRIQEKGDEDMTQFIQKIHNINLPPHQLRELGLSEGWQKKIPANYIEKIVKTAERFKNDLKELSKR